MDDEAGAGGSASWQRRSRTKACNEGGVHHGTSSMGRPVVGWLAVLGFAFNAVVMSVSLYLFRYAIQCGLGVGVYSLFFYVPSLLLVLLAGMMVHTKLLVRTRMC